MNIILAIQPNLQEFNNLYQVIYEICNNYYDGKITALDIKSVFENISGFSDSGIKHLYHLFTSAILEEIKSSYITYIESILILYLEHKRPKYIKRLSCGTFNTVFEISLKEYHIRTHYALRISKNEICKINFEKIEKQEWYDNLLYYNDLSLAKYLKFYPNVIDSSKYPHHVDSSKLSKDTKIYYTHWSVSEIYVSCYNIEKYKNKYIQVVAHLLKIFETNELLYFDWKINNFMIDKNDNLILVDTDFENVYSLMAVCSTHRLTPDPASTLNKLDSEHKLNQATLLMYISAYLSMIAIKQSKTLTDYYMSFKFINRLDNMINDEHTINSIIIKVTNGKYSNLPIQKKEINDVLNMVKCKIDELMN